MRDKRLDPLLLEISSILRLSATSREILHIVTRTKRKLSVADIRSKIHRSERAVRMELGKLSKSGLIERGLCRTKYGRMAYYYYSMPHVQDLVRSTRTAVLRRLRGLKRYL